MRSVSLSQLALQVRQRIELGGQTVQFGSNTQSNSYFSDQELASYLNSGIAELWNLLIRKFGENYAFQVTPFNLSNGIFLYQLPFDFYKILGVDVSNDASNVDWLKVLPYGIHDRTTTTSLLTTIGTHPVLRYQLQGQNLSFDPPIGPLPSQARILYSPQAPILVNVLPSSWTANMAAVPGAQVSVSVTVGGITTNQVFTCTTPGNAGASAPTWIVPGLVTDGTIIWSYTAPASSVVTYFDGISGWEEYPILDACIKCAAKEEDDPSLFVAQKQAIVQRIEEDAQNRQGGDPFCITGGWGQTEGGYPMLGGPGGYF